MRQTSPIKFPTGEEDIRLLFVGDNPDDIRLVREILDEAAAKGFAPAVELTHVEQLDQALDILAKEPFDLVLVDLSLPDSQGLDTVLRLLETRPPVPIIVMSALEDQSLAVEAVKTGAQDYLVKGYIEEYSLTRAIRYAIERKRVEEELKRTLPQIERAKHEWESTVDSVAQFIGLLDDQGRIIRTNRTVEQWQLASVMEVKGRELHDLFHPTCTDPICYFKACWTHARARLVDQRQSTEWEAEDSILKRHLHFQVRPISAQPYPPEKSTASFAVVVVEDITARKQAEAALRRAYDEMEQRVQERTAELKEAQAQLVQRERLAALGQMAATVAHELRNPLMTIRLGVEHLGRDLAEADSRHRYIARIQANIERIDRIVEDILHVVRTPQPTLAPALLRNVIETEVAGWELPLAEKKITCHLQLTDDLPPLRLDPDQMSRVLGNLISNSVDALPPGGEIKITLNLVGQNQVMTFADNGPGIASEHLAQIFEPFFTTKSRGTGLGLYIIKQIIDYHKGQITVWSQVGQGTRFIITLPCRSEDTHGR
jgi:PAS domain S-box-containing protein